MENEEDIHSPRTGNLHNLHVRRVVEPHRTCQVRRTVGSMLTAKGQDLGLKTRDTCPCLVSAL
jgi:hypothetical protein